ncbi:branched-chain amino acid aminotransferase [Niallia oryzisoli]|uniref:Branched-chain amino acid aminotransferase n=1 Tax=Niallia oryzisoli TaxID=1737571 RepID=A0ABZ2CI27_9BACI
MLRKQMKQYVEKLLAEGKVPLEVYKVEKEYIERHQLLSEEMNTSISLLEKEPFNRFQDNVYIERSDKETEELSAVESSSFLDQRIDYFKKNIDQFMYLESPWFDIIGVDAISFEADSVFGNYDVMLGLKLPKKSKELIKASLIRGFQHETATFDLMFSENDGLWDLNFSLNELTDFHEEWTIREAYNAIYDLLFKLVEDVEVDISK